MLPASDSELNPPSASLPVSHLSRPSSTPARFPLSDDPVLAELERTELETSEGTESIQAESEAESHKRACQPSPRQTRMTTKSDAPMPSSRSAGAAETARSHARLPDAGPRRRAAFMPRGHTSQASGPSFNRRSIACWCWLEYRRPSARHHLQRNRWLNRLQPSPRSGVNHRSECNPSQTLRIPQPVPPCTTAPAPAPKSGAASSSPAGNR